MIEVSEENLARMRRHFANLRPHWVDDVQAAYVRMARAAYRPQAPSDGFGHILLDEEQLADPVRLEIESWEAARAFFEADARLSFVVSGCTDGRLAATMYLALEAAQMCCGGTSGGNLRKVLELAIDALPAGE